MFEKEAEEYANGKGHEHYNYLFEENAGTPATFANWCFKDGAEFGYNNGYHDAEEHYMNVIDNQHKLVDESKANEELEEKYKETICNSELNLASITEQLEELEKANEENEGKCKTAYIKGIRTMANALKDYDRTNGVWADYFEHTVEEVLNKLLKDQ